MEYLMKLSPFLAMNSSQLLVAAGWLIGLMAVVGVLWYLVGYFEAPPPIAKFLRGVLIAVALVIFVLFVFHVVGKPPF